MKNYRDSDYAVNKFSKGVVYRFDNETIEITLEDYLRDNPNKTEEDFLRLKDISDEIFLEEIRLETAQGRKLVSIQNLENNPACAIPPVDEQYIQQEKREQDKRKMDKLFRVAGLTEKQKRRLYLHCDFYVFISLFDFDITCICLKILFVCQHYKASAGCSYVANLIHI